MPSPIHQHIKITVL